MDAAAPSLGARGGGSSGYTLRQFLQGSHSWTIDTRVIYYNKNKQSPYNTLSGKYVQIEGRRFASGPFPTLKRPPAPPPRDGSSSVPIASPYAPPPPTREPAEPPREPGRLAGLLTELAATNAGRRTTAFFRSGARGPVAIRSTVYGLAFLLFMTRGVGMSAPDTVNGLALGALYGIIGVALVLIYRTTRIINFAAGAIGAVPAITALLMVTNKGVHYLVALPVAAVGGFLIAALTDVWVLRRFSKSPRLILTVVTIGVAQSFAALGFFIPVWFGAKATQVPKVPTPWGDIAYHNSRGQPILTGDQIFAFGVVLILTVALSVFLRHSRMGIALRASAENANRASLLGIPVSRVTTLAWALAGLLSALAIFAQAPLIGVPGDATLGFDALLYGLTAAVVARMDRFGVALGAGAGIGLIIFASVSRTGSNNVASALMLAIILVALLLQRGSLSRAYDTGVSTWQSVKAFRPIPTELRGVPEVVAARSCSTHCCSPSRSARRSPWARPTCSSSRRCRCSASSVSRWWCSPGGRVRSASGSSAWWASVRQPRAGSRPTTTSTSSSPSRSAWARAP